MKFTIVMYLDMVNDFIPFLWQVSSVEQLLLIRKVMKFIPALSSAVHWLLCLNTTEALLEISNFAGANGPANNT